MRIKIIAMCVASVVWGAVGVQAQGTVETTPQQQQVTTELRVALDAQPVALDGLGHPALAARLLTSPLSGATDAPVRNARVVFESRSQSFYTYVSGWATFYDGDGVRCGEGLFKLDALAPGESAETDLPGLRLKCTPTTWRIVAMNLIARKSEAETPPASASPDASTTSVPAIPPLEININGETHPLQLGNPMEIRVGRRRVRITVNTAP
ncbi:MAG: hypothetical protein WCF57_23815 [Pyrinomonadaceae bacterium]